MMTTRLQPFQTFTIMFVYLLGTSLIFGTPRLVEDTWIVDMISLVPSCAIFMFYTYLLAAGKSSDLYSLLLKTWGRFLGSILILGYTVYFFYIACRNIRDMIGLIKTTLLVNTPEELLILMFCFLIAYATSGGLPTIGRIAITISGIEIFFFVLIAVLLGFSGSIDTERILPLISTGISPVLSATWKSSIWFPYGEIVVFLVFMNGLGEPRQFRKLGLASLICSCIVLTFSSLLQISTLGKEFMKFSVFALMDATRQINIADFITRMDALVAFIIFFSVLIKCSIFMYAGTKGAAYVFKKSYKKFLLPCAILIGGYSIWVSDSYGEHVEEGLKYAIFWLHIPMQLAIPAATLLLVWIRNLKGEEL
ncbi:GerAB/ArcD/ProY family transporter [Paenibacillus graminis]|uniref:GerAB/ArcD/ProY family transporter n=1 Tax=Paenibacillus graminis TaxID=189425 RepID=UPI002DB76B4D|nr:GerAB/ArcD/ProY family transporter [Paenibacillus graminis]MEC0171467.1 GerAB/ArcD/ProY family transporter [Paenibacillus graminis]